MGHVREPVVAGIFYPYGPGELKVQLRELFSGVKAKPGSLGVVSPHAGYAYSGRTAAHAMCSLKPAKSFIILGPNHTGLGPEFSVMASGSWRTPLGDVRVDRELARKLEACRFLKEDALAHSREHSIEVQLPLLQYRFGGFSFVPVCIMNTGYSEGFLGKIKALGKEISDIVRGENTGVVASSDFSHYLPLDEARTRDLAAVEKIQELDLEGFFRVLEETGASVCGFGPIGVMIEVARNLGLKAEVIDSSTSGDATGDTSSVVSYYAIGFG